LKINVHVHAEKFQSEHLEAWTLKKKSKKLSVGRAYEKMKKISKEETERK